jgi:hypothetical protein
VAAAFLNMLLTDFKKKSIKRRALPGRRKPRMSAERIIPIGEQIDEIYTLKQEKKALEEQAEKWQRIIDAKEEILLAALDGQGTLKATGHCATASVGESVVPQTENWEVLWAYIRRNNAFELLQRRVSIEAWREHALSRRDKTVPGTIPFTKRKVSIRVSS